ncbi:hypothetical protein BBK36DRAFT_1142272 [Trichoderma citrinoviride]|uniref:Uncharacterized protein n=1 Tax=Trichoderma citrinoviride TaxID=58853 RepID=A0A2T4B7H5_9HYPO|nr:hypothetical protein BBK36DRAFT_1142272 [Trichoderma citrinoviride]PTB65282.1 hypothetical protein BBK36DRAFT_1142272 [Trichoderma citrinoviride]
MLLKSLLPTLSLLLLSTHATITPPSSFPFSNSSTTTNATTQQQQQQQPPAHAASTTPAPTATPAVLHCDITYCVNGTSYCHFWGGVTTWQKEGPSPGELVTTLGVCKLGRARTTTTAA